MEDKELNSRFGEQGSQYDDDRRSRGQVEEGRDRVDDDETSNVTAEGK